MKTLMMPVFFGENKEQSKEQSWNKDHCRRSLNDLNSYFKSETDIHGYSRDAEAYSEPCKLSKKRTLCKSNLHSALNYFCKLFHLRCLTGF